MKYTNSKVSYTISSHFQNAIVYMLVSDVVLCVVLYSIMKTSCCLRM